MNYFQKNNIWPILKCYSLDMPGQTWMWGLTLDFCLSVMGDHVDTLYIYSLI